MSTFVFWHYFAFQAHWHSLPVRSLAWSLDGEHPFSGGSEHVLVKWNAETLIKEEFAPRQGDDIICIRAGISQIVVVLKDMTVKTFTHNLLQRTQISAFLDAGEVAYSGLSWHRPTATIAFISKGR